MIFLIKFLVSMGGIGYVRVAPGTLASAAALGFCLAIGNSAMHLFFFFGALLLGLVLSGPASNLMGSHDPQPFVMDEACGMILSVLFLPMDGVLYPFAFLLFRLLDVWKPFGIRKLDRWLNPTSIMLDDILAGLYTNLILQGAGRLWIAVFL